MAGQPPRTRSDEALADVLSALASPNRLALLRQLRAPRVLRDIRLTPESAPTADASPERPIARQAVREHLRKLMEAGIVSAHQAEREFGDTLEYVVNHQRLFAIGEELRELANLRPTEERVEQRTLEDNRGGALAREFPRLLLVRGLDEGSDFPLKPPTGLREASWVLGRKRGVAVPVDYDPFVSLENTLVTWRGGAYYAEDLPQSRNGTTLNFERIPTGVPTPLAHGDVLGVGHTLFVFQTHAGRPGGG